MEGKLNNEQLADIAQKIVQALCPPKGECDIAVEGSAEWDENHASGKFTVTLTWDTTK